MCCSAGPVLSCFRLQARRDAARSYVWSQPAELCVSQLQTALVARGGTILELLPSDRAWLVALKPGVAISLALRYGVFLVSSRASCLTGKRLLSHCACMHSAASGGTGAQRRSYGAGGRNSDTGVVVRRIVRHWA